MDIYSAIHKAADHIEAHPEEFDWHSSTVPGRCGDPSCALAWVAAFRGHKEGRCFSSEGDPVGIESMAFYFRMGDLCSHWNDDAGSCAKTLRLYANRYHAPATPDWNALATPDDNIREATP